MDKNSSEKKKRIVTQKKKSGFSTSKLLFSPEIWFQSCPKFKMGLSSLKYYWTQNRKKIEISIFDAEQPEE